MEGKDSGIFSPCQNSNAHPPNYYSSDDSFDEEENQRSLSDSSSNTSYDSDEVVGNWKRRKRMDKSEVKPKKVRYPRSSSDVDSYQKECHPLSPSSLITSDEALSEKGNKERVRDPTTSKGLVLQKNSLHDAGGSSSVMHYTEENKENYRSDVKINMYKVSFPGYKNMITQSCESTGKETIYNFVKRILQMPGNRRRKPNLEKIVFCNANGECLNVGRPVALLSTKETYECYFKNKNLVFNPSDLCRQYAVEDYNSSDWPFGYFLVSCSDGKIAPGVSDFSKINTAKILVDFFNDETIFEALVRDKRFKEDKLRSCGAIFDLSRTPLSSKADNIQGRDIEIVALNEKDSKLPESVSPRPHPNPSVTAASIKPKQIEKITSATCSASCLTPWPVDSSTPMTARPSLKTTDNSARLVDITFDIKCKTFTLGKNARELVKRRKKLENFALKEGCSCYVCEQEELIEIAQSVGAIFNLDLADHPRLFGTCFMIGKECIITNKHVMEKITNLDRAYVNFDFKKEGQANSQRFFIDRLVMCSAELDYAILRMKNPQKQLPPSIFSHGVRIMNPTCPESNWSLLDDMPLRLIGHPQERPKQIDLMCTINARPQSGLECWCYTLRRGKNSPPALQPSFEAKAAEDYHEGKDRRRRTYQSSKFFHGSSGSPGIVHLNDKKWVVVLHARGFKDDKDNFFVEQGVLLTEIHKDVQKQINEAQQGPLKDISVEDLFPSVDCATQACWGEPMELE